MSIHIQILTEIVEARNNDIEIETFVTFQIWRAEVNSFYIRNGMENGDVCKPILTETVGARHMTLKFKSS